MTDDTDLKDTNTDSGRNDDRGSRVDRDIDSTRRTSVREALEKSFDKAREAEGKEPWRPKDRPAQRAKDATAEMRDRKDFPRGAEQTTADAASAAASDGATADAPPAAWTVDAKREWQRLPPAVKAAVAKREIDSAKGVEQLRAQYRAIDEVMAPHLPAIRAHGHDVPTALRQMWGWFHALGTNPQQAFPALARSFGHDPSVYGGAQQQADPAQQLQSLIDQRAQHHVEQRFKTLEEQQNLAHANAVINEFRKTHPHLDRLREKMAALISSGAVPLAPDGSVDLENAYQASIRLDDELFAQQLAEQRAAEKRAEKDRVQRARYAGSSLGASAPGSNTNIGGGKKAGRQSVRDSIRSAIEEVRS